MRFKAWQTEFFAILGHFLLFNLPNNLKNQNFEKMKKTTTKQQKTPKNSWKYHFTLAYHKWWSYDVWLLRFGAWQTEFFVILNYFLPFYFPNNQENQNFEKVKKMPVDIIILHMCTINENHMMYVSWDMEHDRQKFFLFWTIFCSFTPLTAEKIKISKKLNKHLEISSFYTCVPKIMIRRCTVPEIWCVTDITIFHFGLFFALLLS